MAEFEGPSFSLGFDDDDDPSPPPSPSPNNDDPLPEQVPDSESDQETRPDPPRRILKRLRLGPSSKLNLKKEPQTPYPQTPSLIIDIDDDDDDIEDFSSQDEPVQVLAHTSVGNHWVKSSSRVSLKSIGVLTPHPCTNTRVKKRKQVSPLRKFQLIVSDTDDDDEDVSGKNKVGLSSSTRAMFNRNTPLEQDRKTQFDVNRNQDLWKDLSPVKNNFSIPKPAFNEVCSDAAEDVSGKNKAVPSSSTRPMCNQNTRLEQDRKTQFDANRNQDLWKDLSPVKNNFSIPKPAFNEVCSDAAEDLSGKNKAVPSSSTRPMCNRNTRLEQDRKMQFDANRNQDLWKDLSPVKNNFSIPTPAFNELCEEYFQSAKNTEVLKSRINISEKNHNETYRGGCQKDEQVWEAAGPPPPAHRYFFHEDPRIQQLVRSRLCNFSPLGVVNTVNQQQNIDYLGQFNNGGASKTSRGSNLKNVIASEGWVDPKISSGKKATKRNNSKSSEPKDAAQKRVQASGQPAGHWYTGSDGRKVYVTKGGKELSGRNAYRHYRKESGASSEKSKKKTRAKKAN